MIQWKGLIPVNKVMSKIKTDYPKRTRQRLLKMNERTVKESRIGRRA